MIDYDDKAPSRKFRIWLPFTVCGAITIAAIIASHTKVEAAERVKLPTAIEKCTSAVRDTCVVDGDTLWLRGNKIRVADIDTPEISEPKCPSELALGNRATERFIALINEGPFEMQAWPGRDVDRYGRKLRVLTRNGRSLGDVLVSDGLARTWSGRQEPWCDR
ncbi:thermonuclease family protein [Rhizobium binae]|uniref:thermonuclease family protein n=1 Tax=Rhizobium binae TaxID=1138190 RepID=UPI003DAA0B4F